MQNNIGYSLQRSKYSFLPTSRPHKASGVLEIQSKGRLKIAFRRPLLSIYRKENHASY